MRIVSWNVNGIRAAAKKGFSDWLNSTDAELIGLQETRAEPAQVPPELREPEGFHSHWVAAERKGYSGVALLSRAPLKRVPAELGDPEMDGEGRLLIASLGGLVVVNGYFPNGSGKGRDNSRVPFKLDFYRRLHRRLEAPMRAGAAIVVMGDFNTAPSPIDLARPKQNEKTSGFLPEERQELARWLESGWVDSFRHFEPNTEGCYSWWSQRFGVREKNIGWRIDLALVSPGALPFLRGAAIHPDVFGSDHCPISLTLDPAVRQKALDESLLEP